MRRRPWRQFVFRLAGYLGMTVRDLLDRTDSRELTEWQVYEQLTGPLGGARLDYAAAIVSASVVNSSQAKGRARRPDEFLPKWGGREKQSPEEMWQQAQLLNRRFGGDTSRTA
ncbi:hypothetical protein ACL02T_32915 [Pseudonocardia sp. RS010]|uniref:phage tail assembly protein T n=1 Tax=Pseudonocardia sp. RS010 TaxID=3385979 RepID=UPI0039A0544B